MEKESLPKFLALNWETACVFSALPISLVLYLNTPVLGVSDLPALVFSQLHLFLFFSLISLGVKGAKKTILILPVVFITLFNIEHILINEANLNVSYFHLGRSQTFRDSLFTQSFFIHALYLLTCFMVCLFLSHFIKIKKKIFIVLFLIATPFQFLLPNSPLKPNWASRNFLVENIETLFKKSPRKTGFDINSKPQEKGTSFLNADRTHPKNIILIILEGFSQYHIEVGYLPHLKKLQKEAFVLSQFLSHQKQTNRGLFSLLCGDYPNLKTFTAKSDLIISNLLKPMCLPHFLKEMGYENTFLQSAPLVFMGKDQFAKNIGFDFAVGANSFEENRMISSWGVADEDIFSASLEVLSKGNNKKFLTLLTANTHHPYKTTAGTTTFKGAIQHIDGVVASYIEELKKRKLMKDSLIIITSDESFQSDKGLPLHFDNWGFFMAFSKDLPQKNIARSYGQKNLQSSVLDFLKKEKLAERSFFRNYDSRESLIFSNTFQKRLFHYTPSGDLLICSFMGICETKRPEGNLFSYLQNSKEDENSKDYLFSIVEKNDQDFNKSQVFFSARNISLAPKETKTLVSEYKFKPSKKRILIKKDNQKSKVLLKAYICGNTLSMRNWKVRESSAEIPDLHIDQDICMTIGVQNESIEEISMNTLELSRE